MATISIRALDANHDMTWGNGQANYLTDLDAVVQIVGTRLRLLKNEWFENKSDGLPLFQSILGIPGSGRPTGLATSIITNRILGTPYVTGVTNVVTNYNGPTRAYSYSCTLQTVFGSKSVNYTFFDPASLTALIDE